MTETVEQPLWSYLPATEEMFIERAGKGRRIHPDVWRQKLLTWRRLGLIEKDRFGRFKVIKPPPDDILKPPKRSAGSERKRKCRRCGEVYHGISKNFPHRSARVCNACKEELYQETGGVKLGAKSKTCVVCKKTLHGLKFNFGQTSAGGKRKRWKDVCRACEAKWTGAGSKLCSGC